MPANRLSGRGGFDYLDGAGGEDVLTGGTEGNIFHVSLGHDVVTDFAAGDQIEVALGTAFDSFAEVMAVATQSGANVMLTFNSGTTLDLQNVSLGSLGAEDFLFA